jgi:hypothetical protein
MFVAVLALVGGTSVLVANALYTAILAAIGFAWPGYWSAGRILAAVALLAAGLLGASFGLFMVAISQDDAHWVERALDGVLLIGFYPKGGADAPLAIVGPLWAATVAFFATLGLLAGKTLAYLVRPPITGA